MRRNRHSAWVGGSFRPRPEQLASCPNGLVLIALHGQPWLARSFRKSGTCTPSAAAERSDAALRRPAPGPRSDQPAGVRHAARARLAVRAPERTVRDARSHRADARAGAAVRRRDGREHDRRRSSATAASTASGCSTCASGAQGIVHVIGPELGLTQPGMTIACGDSHTSTHGAFGAIAFGIGTSQVRDVLASQCLAMSPLKVRRIDVSGALRAGRLRQGRHPRRSSAGWASTAAPATPTNTPATPSTACRWTSG